MRFLGVMGLGVMVACGTDSGEGQEPPQDGYNELISVGFTVEPGGEPYRCASKTITKDTYISSLRAISPEGAHHSVVSITDTPMGADGEGDCTSADIGHQMIYGAGVKSSDLTLPDGVAIKVAAGSQLQLNAHLFNASDEALQGRSGVSFKEVEPAAVEHEAAFAFAGNFDFTLNDMAAPQTVTTTCEVSDPATVVAILPHMHQLGTHMKIERTSGAVLLDEDFDFYEQEIFSVNNITLAANETFSITCTYENTTGLPVSFGDSSLSEMCVGGLFLYPRTAEVTCD